MALIKCQECGHEVSDKAGTCPHCGCPIEEVVKCEECGREVPQNAERCPYCGCRVEVVAEPVDAPAPAAVYTTNPAYQKHKNLNPKWLLVIVAALVIIGMISLSDSNSGDKQKPDLQTVEDVKQYIEGTVWTYTRTIDFDDETALERWYKLDFKKDGKLYFYEVYPSDGTWGEPKIVDYTVKEKRYKDTGERYIGVTWESGFLPYIFKPSGSLLWVLGRLGYLHKGDANPWN